MIQNIFPHIFKKEYKRKIEINKDDYALIYKNGSILLKEDKILKIKDINEKHLKETIYCGELNGKKIILLQGEYEEKEEVYSKTSYELRKILKKEELWIAAFGTHLDMWYKNNKFCGKCSGKMEEKEDERALQCSCCGNVVYPKVSPAMIVAIQDKGKLLLANNVNWPKEMYSLPAGYVDIGETLEEAVVREVYEELGVDVKNIRYYKSQPWPFSESLMIGFVADGDITQEIKVDKKEINDAKWFSIDELPEHYPNISIAGDMIARFKKNGKI